MIVLGIDPSDTRHAWAVYDSEDQAVLTFGRDWTNDCPASYALACDMVAIEMVACYGMAAGASLFDTCAEIGTLMCSLNNAGVLSSRIHRITRPEVKLAICGQSRAKDANVRQALLDMWGGKAATKKGGPLHGIAGDAWAALAVAVAATRPGVKWYQTAAEKRNQNKEGK